jgi:uncharacterized protein YjiS (DUF1127 family)
MSRTLDLFAALPAALPSGRRPGLIATLRDRLALRRQRIALSRLDDRLLADIGLRRDDAAREAMRPIWDAQS